MGLSYVLTKEHQTFEKSLNLADASHDLHALKRLFAVSFLIKTDFLFITCDTGCCCNQH